LTTRYVARSDLCSTATPEREAGRTTGTPEREAPELDHPSATSSPRCGMPMSPLQDPAHLTPNPLTAVNPIVNVPPMPVSPTTREDIMTTQPRMNDRAAYFATFSPAFQTSVNWPTIRGDSTFVFDGPRGEQIKRNDVEDGTVCFYTF
jgi:hypothetical protein